MLCISESREDHLKLIFFLEDNLHINNSNGPRTELCCAPAFTFVWVKYWPFKTTFCFLPIRKHIKTREKLFEIPFLFSLKIRTSCHTLQNTFYTSRKALLVSKSYKFLNFMRYWQQLIDVGITWFKSQLMRIY